MIEDVGQPWPVRGDTRLRFAEVFPSQEEASLRLGLDGLKKVKRNPARQPDGAFLWSWCCVLGSHLAWILSRQEPICTHPKNGLQTSRGADESDRIEIKGVFTSPGTCPTAFLSQLLGTAVDLARKVRSVHEWGIDTLMNKFSRI